MKPREDYLMCTVLTLAICLVALALASSAGATGCEPWVARVVAVEGSVTAYRSDAGHWVAVQLNETFCAGDILQVEERSRAAVVLTNEAVLRLDENTTVTLRRPEKDNRSVLELLFGAAYFFSRKPRSLKVITPFVNAGVEGTEFLVRVERDETLVTIFEGRVLARNERGSLTLTSGQGARARAGEAPIARLVARPRDAVQWALYYPPVMDYRPETLGAAEALREALEISINHARRGAITPSLTALDMAPANARTALFFSTRAALLLAVGRVDEAQEDITRALALDPSHSPAFALHAVIALVQNDKARALELAKKAVELEPSSTAARIALSYAQQAHFDLTSALASIETAAKQDPESALAQARLAELWLSHGYLDRAQAAAQRAVSLSPELARTRTVAGFAQLTRINIKEAKESFAAAIALDQADPLPRLGLGLARIREGDLEAGRKEIEIAVDLDPNNALLRSYMGKAYFEEKRDKLAASQYGIAKELDPLDPTPWLYDAILKQSQNRPVEALDDLQKSMELNDNRAIYRSRLLLDEDLAARSASLARIYSDLGFQQLALMEGWKSVNADPASYSAHRFLADAYSLLPRHEVARVSELLQSQLLQPINLNPVQPQMAEAQLHILRETGPANPTFNEFTPLFERNRLGLLANGVVGGNGFLGDEVVQSGVWGGFSYSLGQFHFETDGFRPNNQQEIDIYDAFFQVSLTPSTSVLLEVRDSLTDKGDLPLRFDSSNFEHNLNQEEHAQSERFGFHHSFSPSSEIIGTIIHGKNTVDTIDLPVFKDKTDRDGFLSEMQYLLRLDRFRLIAGFGRFQGDRLDRLTIQTPAFTWSAREDADLGHTNLYLYSLITYPERVTWTVGASADFIDGIAKANDQFNPKFGVTWSPFSDTIIRAAVFRTMEKVLIGDQTIEPTQVAGFTQFFRDFTEGTDAWRYGVGIDQRFTKRLFGGLEFARRDMDLPFENLTLEGPVAGLAKWQADLARGYLYWAPADWLALSAEYQYEMMDRRSALGEEDIREAHTHSIPLGISLFHSSGLLAQVKATYLNQDGIFGSGSTRVKGDDQFWVVDAALGYRLPRRWGILTLGVRNLFDETFHFQDPNPRNPMIAPERLVLFRYTLTY